MEEKSEPEVTKEDFKENLNIALNSLANLSPTRNYFFQMLNLLPRDYKRVKEAYPEIFKSEKMRKNLKNKLGMKINNEVKVGRGIANDLQGLSEKVVEFFGDLSEDQKDKLKMFLDRDEIPDLQREEKEHLLRMATGEPNIGDACEKVMEVMFNTGSGDQFEVDEEKMKSRTEFPKEKLQEIKEFLSKDLEILDSAGGKYKFAYGWGDYQELLRTYFGE